MTAYAVNRVAEWASKHRMIGFGSGERRGRRSQNNILAPRNTRFKFVDDGPWQARRHQSLYWPSANHRIGRVRDLQMLEWISAGAGSRLSAYAHHTDATRQYSYRSYRDEETSSSLFTFYVDKIDRTDVENLVGSLPEEYREVIFLHDFQALN
jgi:hypothetical protein